MAGLTGGVWAQRIGLTAAACAVLAILGFYASRLSMPLPIFSGDEAAYLTRALYPDAVVAANPNIAMVVNGVDLSLIRAIFNTGAPFIVADRLANSAIYLAGLALIWRTGTAQLPRNAQIAAGLIALGFPYYRFAFSNLPEGLFVAVVAVICVTTGRWYRSRPMVHAVLSGGLAAALVLVKPHGVAVIAALGALAALDAMVCGGWRRLPMRVALFAAAFFTAGNLIQWAAQEPTSHPWAFFVGDFYGRALAMARPPHALAIGLLSLGCMAAAAAVLAGPPMVIGLTALATRWRAQRRDFRLDSGDLIFLLLVLALGATLVMVADFAVKMAWDPNSTKLLWGRYFEFYVPLLWLAAAPALAQPMGRRMGWACAAVVLAGLVGLLASFHAGVVLFPWDSSAITAFFHPDPVRAPLGVTTPYRALAVAATAAAAAALALRVRPLAVGLALILALAGLSTHLDHIWLGGRVRTLEALDRDLAVVAAKLPPPPADILLLGADMNDADLGFLRLHAQPRVVLGPPAQAPMMQVAGARAVVVLGPEVPPGGPWTRTFRGETLSLFQPAAAP